MEIKQALPHQLQELFTLLKEVALHMRSQGILQWNEQYPTIDHVKNDLTQQNLYCAIIKGKVAGIIAIDDKQSPQYKNISWEYQVGEVFVIHRLAVNPRFQKKGIGKALMDFALEHAQQNGYSSIRLDAYSGNERTIKFYKNRGYKKRGEIYFPYRTIPFYCFEKRIK